MISVQVNVLHEMSKKLNMDYFILLFENLLFPPTRNVH